jgi:hypothetical protein
VGSSTSSRPAQTRALSVMAETLALGTLPNKPLERSGGRAPRHDRASVVAGRSTAARSAASENVKGEAQCLQPTSVAG